MNTTPWTPLGGGLYVAPAGTPPPVGTDHEREQLLDAVAAALAARDLPTVAALVRRLAVHHPDDAQAILDALRCGPGGRPVTAYRVTIERTRTEVYGVQASSPEQAVENWMHGDQLEFDDGDTVVEDVEVAL